MAKLAAVLDRLVREATRLDPNFTIRPETPERVAAAERCMGEQLPDGYREFLEQIGRTHWPISIGNVVDHRSTEVPARFVPFGRRADHTFDIAVFVRRRRPNSGGQLSLRTDLVGMIAARRVLIDEDEDLDEDRADEMEREIADLEDELSELDDKPMSLRPFATKHVPIEWCEREKGTVASAPRWSVDGPWEPPNASLGESITPCPFADWLDAAITQAVAPEVVRPRAASLDEGTERTRQLLETLIEKGAIEVVEGFDEGTAAVLLSPLWGDSEAFHAALLETEGVEEVFVSEDDLEIRFDTAPKD